jgi:HAD superfamily hydrolase (TIGR01509 family)
MNNSYNNILEHNIFIFDFDGIIIDSEPIHNLCWNKVLEKYNIYCDYQKYCNIFHVKEKDGIKYNLKNIYNIDNFDELCDEKNKLYHKYVLNNDIQLINGIHKFLEFLNKNNKKIIIATNTNKNNVEYIFTKYMNNINIFDIFSREMIKNKKPYPDIYNMIAQKYGCDNKYVIFEDSLSGIIASIKSKLNKNIIFFLNKNDYYHYNDIIKNYNVNHIVEYDLDILNKILNQSL